MVTTQGRWAQLRARLWQPPRPHGQQPTERVVGPLELFYDLVVVVLVAQAAHRLSGQLTGRGLVEYAAVFALIWISWVNGSLYHDLHGRDDTRGRAVLLVQILTLVPLGACIPTAGDERGAAFAVTAAILFAILALLWLTATRGDSAEVHRASLVYVAGTGVIAAALAGTVFLPPSARVVGWLVIDVVYLVGFAAIMASPAIRTTFTVTDAVIERFGLFIIIVLGETVTGVVSGLVTSPLRPFPLAVGLVAIVVGFGAWWTYFDFAGHRTPRSTPVAEVGWMLTHLPLTAAVAAMGAAMAVLVEHAEERYDPPAAAWLLCGGAAIVLVASMFIAATLREWRTEPFLYRPLALACAIVALLCLALAALRPNPLVLVAVLVVLLSIPWSLTVVRQAAPPPGSADVT